jgi:hypothetical protein
MNYRDWLHQFHVNNIVGDKVFTDKVKQDLLDNLLGKLWITQRKEQEKQQAIELPWQKERREQIQKQGKVIALRNDIRKLLGL